MFMFSVFFLSFQLSYSLVELFQPYEMYVFCFISIFSVVLFYSRILSTICEIKKLCLSLVKLIVLINFLSSFICKNFSALPLHAPLLRIRGDNFSNHYNIGCLPLSSFILRSVNLKRLFLLWDHSFSTYKNFFRKTNISYPLMRRRTCAYQGVRNVSFSENFAYALNEWPLLGTNQSHIQNLVKYLRWYGTFCKNR